MKKILQKEEIQVKLSKIKERNWKKCLKNQKNKKNYLDNIKKIM